MSRLPAFLSICLLFSFSSGLSAAAPFRLLAIGDSLTEEYRFEVPFSAPDSNPAVANTRNWVELLASRRSSRFSMGNYEPSLFNYADYRNAGFEFNYGVPSFTAGDWEEILYEPGFDFLKINTRRELLGDLDAVDAVLIFLGGNDLREDYGSIFNSDDPSPFFQAILQRISRIHSYVRKNSPARLPILVATIPDIGVTPVIRAKGSYDDPALSARAHSRIAVLNEMLLRFIAGSPDTLPVRIDHLTDRIHDQVPLRLNGTAFIYEPDPENPPLHFFCKLGFHPATAGQALIANEIISSINRLTTNPIPLFTNREILGPILGLDPDQPYLDAFPGIGPPDDDADLDGVPNLVEYLLSTDPLQAGGALQPFGDSSFTYPEPPPAALEFADLTPEQSPDLMGSWHTVPSSRLLRTVDGTVTILPDPANPSLFYRLKATVRP